jgi:hypothetical protein
MNGLEKWSKEETLLPKVASRPVEPIMRSQILSQNSVLSSFSDDRSSICNNGSALIPRKFIQQDSKGGKAYVPSWSAAGPTDLQRQNHNGNDQVNGNNVEKKL